MGSRLVVNVTVRWGDTTLRTLRWSPRRPWSLGQAPSFVLPAGTLGDEPVELLLPRGDAVLLVVPPRASVWVRDGRGSPYASAPIHELRHGARARIDAGAVAIEIDVDGEGPRRPRASWLPQALGHHALSAGVHAGLLAVAAAFTARADVLRPLARVAITADEPGTADGSDGVERLDPSVASAPAHDAASRSEARAAAESAASTGFDVPRGSTTARHHDVQRGVHRGPDVLAARAAQRAPTRGSGEGRGPAAALQGPRPGSAWLSVGGGGASAWSRSPGDGHRGDERDARDARGEGGAGIDDALGTGGLSLSGHGEANGTWQDMIGVYGLPSLGHGEGSTGGVGQAGQGAVLRGTHRVGRILICGWSPEQIARGADCSMSVSGRLPPEAVARVIHDNMGRFRLCYEQGLERRPDLRGRVETRFLIAPDGSVRNASATAEMALDDASVVACVRHAFESLSFPRPAGGTVTVVYPLVLTPE